MAIKINADIMEKVSALIKQGLMDYENTMEEDLPTYLTQIILSAINYRGMHEALIHYKKQDQACRIVNGKARKVLEKTWDALK